MSSCCVSIKTAGDFGLVAPPLRNCMLTLCTTKSHISKPAAFTFQASTTGRILKSGVSEALREFFLVLPFQKAGSGSNKLSNPGVYEVLPNFFCWEKSGVTTLPFVSEEKNPQEQKPQQLLERFAATICSRMNHCRGSFLSINLKKRQNQDIFPL